MPLSARQEGVLHRLVEAYIACARPISSAHVRRQPPAMALSTASIRSCLGQLEAMGLLAQPHRSGGRVPTAAGLSAYLGGLRPRLRRHDRHRLDEATRAASPDAGAVVAQLGARLAALSGLMAVVAVPAFLGQRLHEVALVPLGPRRLMALFVSPSGLVQHQSVVVVDCSAASQVLPLQQLINCRLGGLPLAQLHRRVAAADWALASDGLLGQRAMALAQQILPPPRLSALARGAASLLAQPEFADLCALRALLPRVDDEDFLLALQARLPTRSGVVVVLPQAQPAGAVGQLGCVGQASGPRRDGAYTSIGLWGPARMDYSRLVPLVAHATLLLDRFWQQL